MMASVHADFVQGTEVHVKRRPGGMNSSLLFQLQSLAFAVFEVKMSLWSEQRWSWTPLAGMAGELCWYLLRTDEIGTNGNNETTPTFSSL